MSPNSGVSGLGITFSPSPPRPSSTEREKAQARVDHPRPSAANHREHLPTIRHTVSYDGSLDRRVWDHDGRDSHVMIRDDSGESDRRRVRTATGDPEAFAGDLKEQHHLLTLSPLSDVDSGTSSDYTSYSPASISSLPSSTDEAPRLEYHESERGRLAKSMGAARYPLEAPSTEPAQSRPYPSPIDIDPAPRSYRRPHPNSEAEQPQTSRLPSFLRERPRSQVVESSGERSHIPLAHIVSKSVDGGLSRHSTLLTAGANPVLRSKELDRLLSPTKNPDMNHLPIAGTPPLSASSTRPANLAPSQAGPKVAPATPVVLEQAKSSSKARVELDLVLESSLVVEGGTLKGRIEVRVRKPKDRQGGVWLGKPKVRVVGFEELAAHDARHIFYHHASPISAVDGSATPPTPFPCFDSEVDAEGFQKGVPGQHVVPFSLRLPVGKGAKGGFKGKHGVVRYIVIASMKLKSETGGDRSIAHFYRHVELFPYLNPAIILAPALKPLTASSSKSLFLGGSGKVTLSASMHRAAWVAGQRCYVDVRVENGSTKKIKTLTLTLLRTTTISRPRPWLTGNTSPQDPNAEVDAYQTQTTSKKVAETTLEMGKKFTKGVTSKGSWMGVDGGENADFSHFLLVPTEALTTLRGRYLEVSYTLKVSVGASLSADLSADIGIRVVNFVSLDPPPGHSADFSPSTNSSTSLAKSWSIDQLNPATTQLRNPPATGMTRLASLDSLRLSELNGGRGPSRAGLNALSRIPSLDSVCTDDISRSASPLQSAPSMARAGTTRSVTPSERGRDEAGQAVVGRAKERQLDHQISLDCISSAIASATARRQGGGHQRSASALRSEFRAAPSTVNESDNEVEDAPGRQHEGRYDGGGGERFYGDAEFDHREELRVELDDLDDVPDDVDYERRMMNPSHSQLDLDGDSEDELDAVLAASPLETYDDFEDGACEPNEPQTSQRPQTPTSPRISVPGPRSRPSSPIKAAAEPARTTPKSAMKRPASFLFATAASPLKVISPKSEASPLPNVEADSTSARASGRGPLPAPPASAKPISPTKAPSDPHSSTASSRMRSHSIVKQVSASSPLKRTSGVIAKRPSSRSLALAPSPTLSHKSLGVEDAKPTTAKSTPVLKVTPTPPMVAAPLSPVHPPSPRRKVVKSPSPSLPSTRSLGDLRSASTNRLRIILPSVQSKVAALEVRQTALAKLAVTGSNSRLSYAGAGAGGQAMQRGNSVTESEVSFSGSGVGDLSRASSVSFQAPLFRRVHKEV